MRAISCVTACTFGTSWFGRRAAWAAFFLCTILPVLDVSAAEVCTQKIDLVSGWNAVFVELDPMETVPADLFEDLPVDVVAGFSSSAKPAQFVADPSVDMLLAYGWNAWYSPRRADNFLSTLSAIQGGNPYLIHATTNTQLVIEGTLAPDLLSWTPDAYNFVGFPVVAQGGPTFAEFFSGSPAHDPGKIYRMVNGTWRLVTDTRAVPEFIFDACTPERILPEVARLLGDPAAAAAQRAAGEEALRRLGRGGPAPGLRAARSVLGALGR